MKIEIGYKACYIRDYGMWEHISEVPEEVAKDWVNRLGLNYDSGIGKEWLNKLFVVIGLEHDYWVALYNHDGKYWVMRINHRNLYEVQRQNEQRNTTQTPG